MGLKLILTGLTFIIALSKLTSFHYVDLAGAIIMLLGLVLLWLDK